MCTDTVFDRILYPIIWCHVQGGPWATVPTAVGLIGLYTVVLRFS